MTVSLSPAIAQWDLRTGGILAGAYLIGSLPFGFWVTKYRTGKDIRQHGSGNTGATNVARTQGARWGILVLLLDILKGIGAVLMARAFSKDPAVPWAASCLAIVGHCHTPFLKFVGGKGAATSLGAYLGVNPWSALIAFGTFILECATISYVSMGSCLAATVYTALVIVAPFGPVAEGAVFWTLIAWAVILLRHQSNFRNVFAGREPKLRDRRRVQAADRIA